MIHGAQTDMAEAASSQNKAAALVQGLPMAKETGTFRHLSGVTVLDLTTSVAGPYATMLLSDFGADVIKIERPEGDDARQWGPPFLDGQALWFAAMNRNKKSAVLDLRDPAGMEALRALVGAADVVVTNQPPDIQRKLGLDYEAMRAMREDIIFVSITGFGLTGDRADLTCYDLIAEGYSGVMDLTGALDGAPQKVGTPAADMLAGQDAAMATMAALFDRQRNGRGCRIDISLVESMTRFLACRISSYLGSGEVPRRSGGTDSVIAIYQAFETADHPITLGLGSDAIWRRFWAVLDNPTYAARPEFASNAERRNHRARIVEDIQQVLLGRSRAEWLALFGSARVPAGPINRIDEVAADLALQNRGMIYAIDAGEGRLVPQIGLGIHIDGAASFARTAPPLLGQHTNDILGTIA
jgi:crotonobetainyl-CoA:carnitine CoA-transferase CaiB-like acyl-CoA transferase